MSSRGIIDLYFFEIESVTGESYIRCFPTFAFSSFETMTRTWCFNRMALHHDLLFLCASVLIKRSEAVGLAEKVPFHGYHDLQTLFLATYSSKGMSNIMYSVILPLWFSSQGKAKGLLSLPLLKKLLKRLFKIQNSVWNCSWVKMGPISKFHLFRVKRISIVFQMRYRCRKLIM